MLRSKKILVGVTGSIAAFKSAVLIRLFVKAGCEVKVLMTPLAKEFITPLTLATLSNNAVLTEFFQAENGQWNSHVDLGVWADALVIAPATANTIAKMNCGIADNLLLTTYLSARCPVFIAPAMDVDMLNHWTTRKNIDSLKSNGNIILEPATGDLASGLTGKGRMVEPEDIVASISDFLSRSKKKSIADALSGKKIIITAGPTQEPIDAVRFISNYSSGKMGITLANEMASCGADITLICGPVMLQKLHPGIKTISVRTANEMFDQCMHLFPISDGAVLSAAVADYRIKSPQYEKIKRNSGNLVLELEPTADIAEQLGKLKNKDQFLIGFALETGNAVQNAREKLKKKNFDFIVLNSLEDEGAGFEVDTNKITIINKDNKITSFKLKSKKEVALDIVNHLAELLSCSPD